MTVLKNKGLLADDDKTHNKLQDKFINTAMIAVLPSLTSGFLPFFVKEFYKLRKMKKNMIIGLIITSAYAASIYKPLSDLNQYNRMIA